MHGPCKSGNSGRYRDGALFLHSSVVECILGKNDGISSILTVGSPIFHHWTFIKLTHRESLIFKESMSSQIWKKVNLKSLKEIYELNF